MEYTEQELTAVAGREKNTKRKYLVVNPLQGKHVPVRPGKALELFDALAGLLEDAYDGERLLLIGFAETATAVGAAAAGRLGALYIQTTREQIEGVDYFYFSEQHSHATEQKLVREDLDRAAARVDRIVFIEDEITTGDTIRNIIGLLRQAYPGPLRYSAASLQNGMDEAHQRIYEEEGIRLHWLLKTSHAGYEERISGCRGDGSYHACDRETPAVQWKEHTFYQYQNARRLTEGTSYREACAQLGREAAEKLSPMKGERILVLGTEEFMYPALMTAARFEEEGADVRCHSTTRSPIVVSRETGYPLHARYELASLYDRERRTFVYDLSSYDRVCIVTDAGTEEKEGLYSLVNALASSGNDRISVIRWRKR